MKQFLFILCLVISVYAECQTTQFIKLQGKQFFDIDGTPFFPKIMNYSPSLFYNNTAVSDISHLEFHPHAHVGLTNGLENPNGLQALQFDFQEIVNLGFNTVRIAYSPRRYDLPPVTSTYTHPCIGIINSSLFTFDWFTGVDAANLHNNLCFAIQPPCSLSTEFSWYMQKLQEVVTIASNVGLRVILVTGDGFGLFSSQQAVDEYEEYLREFVKYFKYNYHILAYDLDNEPNYKDGENDIFFRPKYEVCNYSEQLYNAVKAEDPNHLITIGLGDESTIFNWDPDVIKCDFTSFHFYPTIDYEIDFNVNSQSIALENALYRTLGQIYWASNHLTKPWVLEEYSFLTRNGPLSDYSCYGLHGTFAQGVDYTNQVISKLRDCGASGYAFWALQDNFIEPDPSCVGPLEKTSREFRERYFGLLNPGNPINGDYTNLRKGQLADVLNSYNWTASLNFCTEPPNYRDPFLFASNYNTTDINAINGQVLDQNNEYISNAVIQGLNYFKRDPLSLKYIYHWIYTFTNEYGMFKIVPYSHSDPNIKSIPNIIGSAASSHYFNVGSWPDELVDPVGLHMTALTNPININSYKMEYNESLDNLTVLVGEFLNFKGWNSLTIASNSVLSGNSTISARENVTLVGEVELSNNSEIHLFTDDTFKDCIDFNTLLRQIHQLPSINTFEENDLSINLSFIKSNDYFSIDIHPNPTVTDLYVLINAKEIDLKKGFQLNIRNALGETIQSFNTFNSDNYINLNLINPGVYFVEVFNDEFKKLTKFLKL